MIGFNSAQRFFIYRGAIDMRKSFDGLCGVVSNELGKPLTTGDVFIFINKPRHSIKLLVWDRNGFVIWYKRLEQGTFEMPGGDDQTKELKINWDQLVMILEGITLGSVKRKKRFTYPQQ
ncbi:MAG: IS66 family insertion sequence element accessory protein TnpB [Chitinophagales bacterium]